MLWKKERFSQHQYGVGSITTLKIHDVFPLSLIRLFINFYWSVSHKLILLEWLEKPLQKNCNHFQRTIIAVLTEELYDVIAGVFIPSGHEILYLIGWHHFFLVVYTICLCLCMHLVSIHNINILSLSLSSSSSHSSAWRWLPGEVLPASSHHPDHRW